MVDESFSDETLAALYDRLYPPSESPDFDFYMRLVMAGSSVLDVGCGTGALLHAARQAGHSGRLCGLDPAAGMLARARKHPGIEWICGDLTSVEPLGEFDLILMTGHTFQVFVEDQELRAALAAVRRALKRDGRFAFDTRNPAARTWESWTCDRAAEIRDEQGAIVRVARRVDTPFNGRTLSFTETFSSPSWDRSRMSRSTLRFLDAASLAGFLADTGMAIEEQFGDWDSRPLTPASLEIITIARPAPT
jgi:SAM-dependent methyltransferase